MRPLATIVTCVYASISISLSTAGAFEIPRGAWQWAIGDVPRGCESNCPNRGIALGGFGAGSFMYSITGNFGPWADEVGEYSRTWRIGAAFHIYEKRGEAQVVKCLSTEPFLVPETWNQMALGEGTYYALQPKGWCVYDKFRCEISSGNPSSLATSRTPSLRSVFSGSSTV